MKVTELASRLRRLPARGECYCCSSTARLYAVGTIVGVRHCCARCCRETYGLRPGFTYDGAPMPNATAYGVEGVRE